MPQVLTLTKNEDETDEQFAARLSAQMQTFFGEGAGSPDEGAGSPDEPAPPEASSEPTDVSAEESAPPEEVAPPG